MATPYPYQPPPVPTYTQTAPRAKKALWFGLISFFCCGLFLGIPAIFVGVRALSEIEIARGGLTGKGLAWAGIVLGILGTLRQPHRRRLLRLPLTQAESSRIDQFSRSRPARGLPRVVPPHTPTTGG
jgi:hypothetical protein